MCIRHDFALEHNNTWWIHRVAYWTINDHGLKVADITSHDIRSFSFYFLVCLLSVYVSVCLSVCLSTLCTPHFWSHKLANPYSCYIFEKCWWFGKKERINKKNYLSILKNIYYNENSPSNKLVFVSSFRRSGSVEREMYNKSMVE